MLALYLLCVQCKVTTENSTEKTNIEYRFATYMYAYMANTCNTQCQPYISNSFFLQFLINENISL